VRVTLDPEALHGPFVREIEAISEQNLLKCNQSAEVLCQLPAGREMDLLPNQIIRLAG
jgi:hypothetical protein